LAIGFAVPVLAKEKDTADPQMAQQIRALAMKYDAAFNRNDPAAVAALYTEDAVFVTPQGTFYGPQAIEKRHANEAKEWVIGQLNFENFV
jgi:uncharacterized protein (TIGR02246 family)